MYFKIFFLFILYARSRNNTVKQIEELIQNYNHNDELSEIATSNGDNAELISSINNLINLFNKELHSQQLRLSIVNKAVSSGMWYMKIDESCNVETAIWSDEFRHMIGFKGISDFPNVLNAWSDRLHPKDAGNTLNSFVECITDFSGRTPYDVNYRLKLKDNSYKWFRAAGHTIRDEKGHPVEIIGVFIDIDEEYNRKQELDYTLKRYEAIDGVLTEGSWNMRVIGNDPTNPNNEFWWSDQFRKLLKFESERDFPNILSSWSDKLHPQDKASTLKAFSDHLMDYLGRTPFDLEYRLETKLGEYRWFHATGQTVRKDDGTPVLVAGAIEDITAKKAKDTFTKELDVLIEDLFQSIGEITTAVTHSTENTMHISEKQVEIKQATDISKEATNETLKLIDLILNISSQTNLLALNTSIDIAVAM